MLKDPFSARYTFGRTGRSVLYIGAQAADFVESCIRRYDDLARVTGVQVHVVVEIAEFACEEDEEPRVVLNIGPFK